MTGGLRALIFDVDGTLAETEELHRQAFNETFEEAGLDWCWSRSDYRILLRTTGGKERMRRHRDDLGASRPGDKEIAALHQQKTARYAALMEGGALTLREGVHMLVAAGRKAGLKIAVATTTSRSNVEVLCRTCWGQAGEEVFDIIAAGDEVAAKKPAPDVFRLALHRLGVPASRAIAFEDSVAGLAASQAAGLSTVVTPSAYTEGDDFSAAAHVCPSLSSKHLPESLRRAVGI